MPSDEWVHDAPRSSARNTAGPYHGVPPPAESDPLAGSHWRSWIGHPSHIGSDTDQALRSRPPSRMNAPLRVPTGRSVRVMWFPPRSVVFARSDGVRVANSSRIAGNRSVARLERVDDPAVGRD